MLTTLFSIGGGSARADPVQSVPAANAVVRAVPTRIVVYPGGTVAAGTPTMFAADHTAVSTAALRPAGAGALAATLVPESPVADGVYSVVWQASDTRGTYAFEIETSGTAPSVVTAAKASTPLGPLQDGVVAWTAWITLMTLVGVTALGVLVTGPVTARSATRVGDAARRRLSRVALVAGVLYLPALLLNLAHDGSDDGGYDLSTVRAQFTTGFAGFLLSLGLLLTVVAIALLIPGVSRTRGRQLLTGSLIASAIALLTTKFPADIPPNWPRTIFQTVMWCGHLLGAAVWIGGLVGLLALALPGVVGAEDRSAFWPPAIRRFSIVAMSCVGALTLSGLWLYWVHIDGIHQLVSTMYGRVLGVKLLGFGGLLAIGAFNQFVLSPKLDALRAAGEQGSSAMAVAARHFRGAIAIEVVLGFAVLLIAPFLGGSARNQAFQAAAADLTQRTGSVAFTPSGLQPGLTDYTVRIPGDAAQRVSVTFSSTDLAVPAQTVAAVRTAPGTYRVSGYYTAQIGTWQAAVAVDGTPATTFTLPVTATPAKLGKAPTPQVRWTTWAFGIGETLAVIAGMIGAFLVSGRIARHRVRTVTPPAEQRELVDA